MKRIFLFALLTLATITTTFAQTDSVLTEQIEINTREDIDEEDAAEIKIPNGTKKGRLDIHWFGLDFAFNGYTNGGNFNLPSSLDAYELNYGRSTNWTIHLFRQSLAITKNNSLKFVYGPSFSFSRFNFANSVRLPLDESTGIVVEEGTNYRKNRLYNAWVNVPVMFEVETKPNNRKQSFRLGLGAQAGFLIGSNQKFVSNDGAKDVVRNDFGMNKFRYGIVGRIGFGNITLTAEYTLNPLFKSSQMADLNTFAFGICLVNFK